MEDDAELNALKKNWTPIEVFGFIAGIIPFFVHVSETTTTTTSTSGGSVDISSTTTKHMDYVAVGGGAIAIVCALLVLLTMKRARSPLVRVAVFGALALLGGIQIWLGISAPDL